jgi:hypothetical protein
MPTRPMTIAERCDMVDLRAASTTGDSVRHF